MKDLIDVFPVTLSINESEGGKIRLRGPFGHTAVPTSNNRLYGRKIMEREFKRVEENIGNRNLFGELDHPLDGRTSLQRVSHIVTGLRIDENGEVHGEIEPLPTPMGSILTALAKAGCTLGVSSRGRGSVVTREDGVDEVQDDFALKTYDVVDNPASKNAWQKVEQLESADAVATMLDSVPEEHRAEVGRVIEAEVERAKTFTLEDITDPELRDRVAKLIAPVESAPEPVDIEAVRAEVRAEVEAKAEETITKLAEKLREDLTAEFLADPGVAASKTVLEAVIDLIKPFTEATADKVESAKDTEILRLRTENKSLADALKDAEFKTALVAMESEDAKSKLDKDRLDLHLESKLLGHPKAEKIRTMVGAVAGLTVEAVNERLAVIFSELGDPADFRRDPTVVAEEARAAIKAECEAEAAAAAAALVKDAMAKTEAANAKVAKLSRDLEEAKSNIGRLEREVAEATTLAESIEADRDRKALRLHAYKVSAGMRNQVEVVKLCEGAESAAEINAIVSRQRSTNEESSSVAPRGRGVDLSESTRQSGKVIDGVDVDEALALAGVKTSR